MNIMGLLNSRGSIQMKRKNNKNKKKLTRKEKKQRAHTFNISSAQNPFKEQKKSKKPTTIKVKTDPVLVFNERNKHVGDVVLTLTMKKIALYNKYNPKRPLEVKVARAKDNII